MNNWITLAVNDCFHSPYELLVWYACNMDTLEVHCLRELFEAFLTAKGIERIDLSDWPTYRLGASVQEIEGNAPTWLRELDTQMGMNPGPLGCAHHPASIIADIAWAWERKDE